jgi:hypothetical protein
MDRSRIKSDDETVTYQEQEDWVIVYEGQDENLEVIAF